MDFYLHPAVVWEIVGGSSLSSGGGGGKGSGTDILGMWGVCGLLGGGGGVKTPERVLYRSVILYETVSQIPNTSE